MVLDTDIMIDVLRGFPPAVDWLESLEDTNLILPGYVIMELIQGCHNKKESAQVQKLIEDFSITWPTPEVCNQAMEIFSSYHLSHSIGLLDALIGQTAVSLNLPLCTFNQKHYNVIPNLSILKPYSK